MRLVPVSLVMAGAALEANANEALQNILYKPASLSKAGQTLLSDLKKERYGNAVEKFRRLALLMDKVPNVGTSPWQSADLLVRFRNEFMHFKPSWDDDDIHAAQPCGTSSSMSGAATRAMLPASSLRFCSFACET